jgi:endoglucanase
MVLMVLASGLAEGASLRGVQVVDKDYLMVRVVDGEVIAKDDGLGEGAFTAFGPKHGKDKVVLFGEGLDVDAATRPGNWTIQSGDDATYGRTGTPPAACHRKTKVNGHSEQGWVNNDYHYEYAFEHFIYLKLPHSLQQGATYTLSIAPSVRTDATSAKFTFDIFTARSEAIHVNLVGYLPQTATKSADLFHWMGDGGARDYRSFEGNTVHLYDVAKKHSRPVGAVRFWKKAGIDVGFRDLTKSNVWIVDVTEPVAPGTYRIAVDGIGCSQDFGVRRDIYHDPYKVSVKGFYYMRIGEKMRPDIRPVPRQPRYIPDQDPADTKVYLTTMHPYHGEWNSFSGGGQWDKPDAWARFRKEGNPTNPNAWGGHSDALDWDRHLGHVSIVYDMLLPFILSDGALTDDDLGIAESGNGIPDLLDEARNEVDYWLRLRDGDGYSHGLTNPNKKNELYQAGPTAIAAWANAANAAMLAECFLLARKQGLATYYRDEAVKAYAYAGRLNDPMLDRTQDVGEGTMRGRDFKMTAAAYLYNVTGQKSYEDDVKAESLCTGSESVIEDAKKLNQLWATAGYLKTTREVRYPELRANMKSSIVHQSWKVEMGQCDERPSRRATNRETGYFRTIQNVQATLIAHAVAETDDEKGFYLNALALEADYGLGRNTMNMIQMTTATTELANKRSVLGAYTSGRNDGSPGMHPGHTPYMNLDDWGQGMTMGIPSRLHGKCYPGDFKQNWPADEGYFDTRWVWAHNEFTPQQTMRGKLALYGYLYSLCTRR